MSLLCDGYTVLSLHSDGPRTQKKYQENLEIFENENVYKLMDNNPVKKLNNQVSRILKNLISAGKIYKQDQ